MMIPLCSELQNFSMCNDEVPQKNNMTPLSPHTTRNTFSVMDVNARSILPKSDDLQGLHFAYNSDVTVISETWLHDKISDEDTAPSSHEIVCHNRRARGGGIAVVLKKSTEYTVIPHNTDVETLWIHVRLCHYNVLLGALYRSA